MYKVTYMADGKRVEYGVVNKNRVKAILTILIIRHNASEIRFEKVE